MAIETYSPFPKKYYNIREPDAGFIPNVGITVIFINQDACLRISGIPQDTMTGKGWTSSTKSGNQKALSLAWRIVVRDALSRWSGIPAGGLTISTDPGGKPNIVGPDGKTRLPHQFNASHTKGGVVIALRPDAPVGIDMERRDRRVEWRDLAQRYLPVEDQEEILQKPENDRCPEFIRRWTRLEAILKMRGEGVQKLFNESWKADVHTQFRDTVYLYPNREFTVCVASPDVRNTPIALIELQPG